MEIFHFLFLSMFILSCSEDNHSDNTLVEKPTLQIDNTSIVILGTIQDAGSPQITCNKKCCAALFGHPDNNRQVVSLGLVDTENHKTYLFDAIPDIGKQMKRLTNYENESDNGIVDGIFLTHAHIGQYTGLMF